MCVRVRMRAAAVLTVGRGDLRAVEHGVRAQQLVGSDLVLIGHQPRDGILVFQEASVRNFPFSCAKLVLLPILTPFSSHLLHAYR